VVTTIFVNPTQFGPGEDFTRYPRDLDRDLGLFEQAGVDVVFTPTPALMYPDGFQTSIENGPVASGLEGAARPDHFRGVSTVVAKLFNLTQPTRTYFGQKDAQQVAVIRRMAADLNFPLEIIPCPTEREADGLAMSSRNRYLSVEERRAAAVIYAAIRAAGRSHDAGERSPEVLKDVVRGTIAAEPLAALEYVSVADARTLRELDAPAVKPVLLSLTVRIGQPRLLDNALLPLHLNTRAGLLDYLGRP
jgi:pantoate--beta-alanine ligase